MKAIGTVIVVAALVPLLLHSRAEATPITATLDYSVTFGTHGTDTITGTEIFDPTAQTIVTSITVTGAFDTGHYSLGGGNASAPISNSEIGAQGHLFLDQTFSPSTFSSSITFTAFGIIDTSTAIPTIVDSTSVTNLAATGVPEPSSLASLAAGLAVFGFWAGRRQRAHLRNRHKTQVRHHRGITRSEAIVMKSIGAVLTVVALVAAAPLSAARADLIYDLNVAAGSGFFTGSGSIDLTTLSGTSTAGVAAFSFHAATGNGVPQDYTLGDINTISWSIDSSDDLSLLLISDLLPLQGFPAITTAILLTDEGGSNPSPCSAATPEPGSITCAKGNGNTDFESPDGVLTATLAAVPEPSSLASLAAGLVVFGFCRGRRRRVEG
jgi:hypothetical protein